MSQLSSGVNQDKVMKHGHGLRDTIEMQLVQLREVLLLLLLLLGVGEFGRIQDAR